MSDPTSNAVFISYRREKTVFLAIALHQRLESLGVDAFIDMESIGAGQFDTIILNQIGARPYYVLVLTPGTLQRCVDPGDWLRREIEQAVATKRVIVPVYTPDFDFDDLTRFLPESGLEVARFNGHELPATSFETAVGDLVKKFLLPRETASAVLPPTEQAVVDRMIEEARAADRVTEDQLAREEAERAAREEAERAAREEAARQRRRRMTLWGSAAALVVVAVAAVTIVALGGGGGGDDDGDVVVPGNVEWTDTSVDVAVGDSVVVDATGTIHHAQEDPTTTVGPDGASDDELRDPSLNEVGVGVYVNPPGHGGLIGKVGENGDVLGVGSHFEVDNLSTGGTLYLGINDYGVDNNDGSFQATITATR
jgi:TIR domain